MSKPVQRTMHEVTLKLANAFQKLEVGQEMSYEEATRIAGVDIRPGFDGYRYASSARIHLERFGIFIGCISKEGFKRMDPTERLQQSQSDVKSVHRKANRAKRRIVDVDPADVPENMRLQLCMQQAWTGAIAQATSKRMGTRIQKKLESDTSQLNIGETMKLFSSES
jgi:hypothetical protein